MSSIKYTIANNIFWFGFLKKWLKTKGVNISITSAFQLKTKIPFIYCNHKWICLPHLSVYGKLNKCDLPPIQKILSRQHLPKNFSDNGLKWEIRSFEQLSPYYCTCKVLSIIELRKNPDIQFNALKSNLRRKIRKAEKNGITIQKAISVLRTENMKTYNKSGKLLKDFYTVYSKRMHELGSPALGHKFFYSLFHEYENGLAVCYVAYQNQNPIGCAFALSYKTLFENCWFATLGSFNKYYPSYALHWAMIQTAIQHQYKIYSFGRSTINSGVHHYKKQWGCLDQQIYWNYSHPPKKNIRDMKWASKVWKKMPLWICNLIGPIIAKRVN